MSSPNTKKIIIAASAALVLAIGAYFFLSGGSASVALLVPEENQEVGQDILILVDKLESIAIDASLFSSTLFANLKDATVPLIVEPQGRPNPFAPIGSDSGGFVQSSIVDSTQAPLR